MLHGLGELVAWVFFFFAVSTPLALALSSRIAAAVCFACGVAVGTALFCMALRLGARGDRMSGHQMADAAVLVCGCALKGGSTHARQPFRFSVAAILLGLTLPSLFLAGIFHLERLPWAWHSRILLGLFVLCLVAPICMLWLPRQLRWWLWTLVYLYLFIGSRLGIESDCGVLTAFAAGLGSLAGLIINQRREQPVGFNSGAAAHPLRALSFSVIGFILGVTLVAFSVPVVVGVTSPLRGSVEFISEWATVSRTYDRHVNSLIGGTYVGLAFLTLRFYLGRHRVGVWRGSFMGSFVVATCIGVLAFCFH